MEANYSIRWIVIYPVDSAIQHLNKRGLMYTIYTGFALRVIFR